MLLIDSDTVSATSQPFEVKPQATVFAANLAGSDYVEFEVVAITPARRPSCECPPVPVVLPAVVWSAPLLCCGQPVRLTATNPYVLIDHPQGAKIRARLVTAEVGWTDKVVWLEQTAVDYPNDRMRGCTCD